MVVSRTRHKVRRKGGSKMAKIIVEMEFDFDGFDELTDEEKFSAIDTVLESGAESTCSTITVNSIEIKNKD
jgi:hypothetical protein